MKPTIALTMGDPAGIGPEIIVAAWPDITRTIACRPVVIGHSGVLEKALALRRIDLEVVPLERFERHRDWGGISCEKQIPCLDVMRDDVLDVAPGTVDARTGRAACAAISTAIDFALNGNVDAIVTAPIHKEAMHLAGFPHPGHTEFLAERCGVEDYAMMLYLGPGENLRGKDGLAVVHVTLHTAMRSIFEQITHESVLRKIRLIDDFMSKIKGSRPRIGVCSLNPHAGENGLFGDEEIRIIRPAVEQARDAGIGPIAGPLPADTIMIHAKDGLFDAVVAMFHDQGHIALKLLGMYRAVNITLGLPIIRTSVAHGTAFDRAWNATAEAGSMIEAVRVAAKLARNDSGVS